MIDKALMNEIERRAAEVGEKIVRETLKGYLLRKTYTREGVVLEKRKRIPRAWILEALDRQQGRCPRCPYTLEVSDLTGDHIIPLSQGGRHDRRNISAMHRRCNSAKGSRSLAEDVRKQPGLGTVKDYLERIEGPGE